MRLIKDFFYKNTISIVVVFIATILLLFYYLLTFDFRRNDPGSEIEIYYADNISRAHQKLIDDFNSENAGRIKVIPIDLPFHKFSTNERKELLARALRSKSKRIDVFAVDLIWVSRFAKWCEPLDDYLTEEISEFQGYALESCYYNGKLMAIPSYMDISLLYYRDDLLKELPNYNSVIEKLNRSITWSEFIELSKNFDIKSHPYYIYQADDYEGLICSYYELILNRNPDFFKSRNPFESQVAKNSLQLLVDLVNKYQITPKGVTNFKENTSYKYFLDNNGIFLRGWQTFQKDYKNLIHDSVKESNIKLAPLPHSKGSGNGTVFGGWNLMVSKNARHKSEVMEFVKYLTSREAQEILFEMGTYLPTRKVFYEDNKFSIKYPRLADIDKLLNNGIHRPFLERYTRNSDIVSHYANLAISNKLTVDEAINEMVRMLNSSEIIIK